MIEPLPFFQNFSRLRVFSETQKGSPILFFGNVSEKHVDRNSWYSSPLLSIENFDTGVFLKNRTLPPPKVLGYVIMTLFHGNSWYSLVLFHRRYRFWNFSERQKVYSTTFQVLWDEKKLVKNLWYNPYFLSKNFFDSVFSPKHRRVPLQIFFGTVRQKLLDQNSWYNLLLSIEIFDAGVFLKNRRLLPHKVLGSVIMKRIDGNFWYSLVLIHRQKQYRKIFEVQKASSTKLSVLWDRNCSTEILNTPSLLDSHYYHYPYRFSLPEFFLKHRRRPL